ncbi:MAG: NAD-dependent epimerase/dehydratase family protein [Acidobacteriota bacterium]
MTSTARSSTIDPPAEILVTGGAGYVGSALVPHLLARGYGVRALDLFWYGHDVFPGCHEHPRLRLLEGDVRDPAALAEALEPMPRGAHETGRVDAVIHLACISNDPSFELDPALGRSINLDAFPGLVDASLAAGVQRFVYASSSSIYGVQDAPHVVEETSPEPLTDYSRFKLACERLLLEACAGASMTPVIVRPATVCGAAPRQRLDLTINILTAHALERGLIRVFGGSQLRPNLHIGDMVRAYDLLLTADDEAVRGEAFNVGFENHAVAVLADLVRDTLAAETGASIAIRTESSDDLRSYHIDSSKIRQRLGFAPRHTLADAVRDLAVVHAAGHLVDPLTNPRYHNIRRMQEILAAG